jgi:hypothetical protein
MQDMEHRKSTYSILLKILKRNIPQVSAIRKWENIKIGLQGKALKSGHGMN